MDSGYSGDEKRPRLDIITTCQVPAARPVHLATEISATRLDKMLKRKEVERAFLGIIRLVQEDPEGMEAPKESMTTQKPKWDQALPSQIRAVLEEFDDVFP